MTALPAPVSTELIWAEVEKQHFAVLSWVSSAGEPRTAGIVYTAKDGRIYVGTERDAWKARHIAVRPQVSMTITVPRRVPFVPWIPVPPATITLQGTARLAERADAPQVVQESLLKGLVIPQEYVDSLCLIVVEPQGNFLTYGIGVSLSTMRRPFDAGGRAPVV